MSRSDRSLLSSRSTLRSHRVSFPSLELVSAGLGLESKAAKTRIVHLTGGHGRRRFDFLGFHHWLVRGQTPKSAHVTFLARWPSRKAVQHALDRIREITAFQALACHSDQLPCLSGQRPVGPGSTCAFPAGRSAAADRLPHRLAAMPGRPARPM